MPPNSFRRVGPRCAVERVHPALKIAKVTAAGGWADVTTAPAPERMAGARQLWRGEANAVEEVWSGRRLAFPEIANLDVSGAGRRAYDVRRLWSACGVDPAA